MCVFPFFTCWSSEENESTELNTTNQHLTNLFEKADIRDEEDEFSTHIDKAEHNYNIAS